MHCGPDRLASVYGQRLGALGPNGDGQRHRGTIAETDRYDPASNSGRTVAPNPMSRMSAFREAAG